MKLNQIKSELCFLSKNIKMYIPAFMGVKLYLLC